MSFSLDVKKETAKVMLSKTQAKAQLAAMIQASLNQEDPDLGGPFKLTFSHVFLAKRYVELMKALYGIECEIEYVGKKKMTQTSSTSITIHEKVKIILEDLGLFVNHHFQGMVAKSLVVKDDDARAYIAGWFLIKGSINSPNTSNYHLEIRFKQETLADFVSVLLQRFYIQSKLTNRRHEKVLYIKSSEQIGDVLRLIGASNALLEFEDIRIHRDFHNSLTRLDNCEVSNEMKSIQTGHKQVEAIEKLIRYKRLNHMEKRLQEVAHLRLKHPEHSLKELAEEYEIESGESISKSGMKHRLDKLMDAANRIND